jgi:murein DD-endopeptidase MepM/ murein hydrolase activator NlpD
MAVRTAVLCACAIFSALLGYSVGVRGKPRGEPLQRAESEQGGAEVPIAIEPNPLERAATEIVGRDREFVFPIAPGDYLRYTSPFGHRVSPLLGVEMVHQGVDIAAVWRAEVVAIADGVVVEHWPVPGTPYPGGGEYRGHDVMGGLIVIDHGDGIVSRYGHLSYSRVAQGQRVSAGEVIGRIGNTGRSDGEHLHLTVEIDGKPVNPLLYLPDPRLDY